MGFTLSLSTCNLSDAVRVGANPFTGEPIRAPVDAGLTETEMKALFGVLADLGASPPDDNNYCYVHFTPERCVGISAGSIDDDFPKRGFALEVEGQLDDAVVDMIWKIALAGNLSIGSSIDPSVVALTQSYADPRVSARWPSAPILQSAFDLKTWLDTQLRNRTIV